MRTTMCVQFYCRRAKAGKDNKAAVQMSLILNGERKFINLPWKCDVDEFNKKRKPTIIQQLEREWSYKVDVCVAELLRNGEPLTTENIREVLKTGGVRSYTIRDCFNDYLKTLSKRVDIDLTHSAYRKYELTRDIVFAHINPDMQLSAINSAFIEDLYNDLKRIYQVNSSASYMAKIKTFILYAINNGKLTSNPFQNVKIKREVKQIEYLTEEEIKVIEQHRCSTEALERCKDVFLMQVYSGLSFIDLENLRKEDIRKSGETYYIQKPRQKTKVEYTAVLFPEAITILEKYDYKLPIISNQKTNSALKALARECGINKRVYNHLGRKTYGTRLLNRNVRMEVVAKCLGHSEMKTTARFYASLHKDSIIEEVSNIF